MSISYKDAGVDIDKGDQFVEKIKKKVLSTYNARVVEGIGGFACLYEMTGDRLLAAGTDGVGTKLKVAQNLNIHGTIGIDLVAMCVNDIICTGAKPLFFMDYLATGKLELEVSEAIIEGVVEGCLQSGAALIGGETAEMPGMYQNGEYDLAGFAVGEVDRSKLLDGSKIKEGDSLIALASSGFHSNGYSLIRKLIREEERDLLKEVLTPTKIYVKEIQALLEKDLITGAAHITGGGLYNIPRMNKNYSYEITNLPSLDEVPAVISEIANRSGLEKEELYKTFNMGMGMVVSTNCSGEVKALLKDMDVKFWEVGKVVKKIKREIIF